MKGLETRIRGLESMNKQMKAEIAGLKRKNKVHENQLSAYLKLIKRIRARINAIDHKDNNSRKG